MRFYFLLSLIPFLIYFILKSKKALHMLQQNWYNEDERFFKWIIQNRYRVFVDNDMLFVVAACLAFVVSPNLAMILFAFFYMVVTYLYFTRMRKEQVKKPLVFTKRVMRLCITIFLLYLIAILPMVIWFDENLIGYYYFILGALIYFHYFVVMLAAFINVPIEKGVFYYYKHQASRKLASLNRMKVIGITGSYGKTSSKNILNDILNVKYIAFATPKNFNTTYGLINTVNNYLDKFNDYFIAEMGAFKRGEIKELCDFVKPTYGILTTIGTAHLESFGSRENIQQGKFELIESLPSDGCGILNADDPYQRSYELKNDCKILWIGIENHDVDLYATNIKLSHQGTSFDCVFKGDKTKYHFETRLLGRHNIYNILSSICLGKYLGISIPELQLAVKRVNPVEHRLELKKYGQINIIDDAYNSNPVGSKMAVEVLGMMPGKRIIVTPGMIELGIEQYEFNNEFGHVIADHADIVILIGKDQTKPIYDGLKEEKFKEKNIYVLNDVKEAFPLVTKLSEGHETYVLLENDLPDIFNE